MLIFCGINTDILPFRNICLLYGAGIYKILVQRLYLIVTLRILQRCLCSKPPSSTRLYGKKFLPALVAIRCSFAGCSCNHQVNSYEFTCSIKRSHKQSEAPQTAFDRFEVFLRPLRGGLQNH